MLYEDDSGWPTSGDQFSHPQRDADLGKPQEFGMASVGIGGFGNIRTVEWQDSDGAISRLRTRGGWPVFETDRTEQQSTFARGFVAKIPDGIAVLFNPYTLAVLVNPYVPAVNTYAVMDFKTTWNVPPGDTTNWGDVVLFDGATVKVNNLAMAALQIPGDHGYLAIPYVINRNDASNQYGNTELNSYEKRVFAVGRDTVTSWGGAGTAVVLAPSNVRTDPRTAFTIGQATSVIDDSADIGQIYHAHDTTWDSNATEWVFSDAHVALLLAAPYLTAATSSTTVVMPAPDFSTSTPTSGSGTTPVGLPSTPVAVIGTGEVSILATTGLWYASIVWPWTDKLYMSMDGEERYSYTGVTLSDTESQTNEMVGETVTYSGQNSKTFNNRGEELAVLEQLITYANHTETITGAELGANATTLFWGAGVDDLSGTRGRATFFVYNSSISPRNAERDEQIQDGSFSVNIAEGSLVSVSFSRYIQTGEKWIAEANDSLYDEHLNNPYDWVGNTSGMGVSSQTQLQASSACSEIYKQNPSPPPRQTPSTIQEIVDEINSKANDFTGQTLYDNKNNDADYNASGLYTTSIDNTVSSFNQSLQWDTVDYVLFDKVNGVFITVEGYYSGSSEGTDPESAALSVLVRVKTRYHENTQVIGTYSYNTVGLPVEVLIATDKFAIPSPKIRAMFTPLHREQGSFKGAHYVELAEEALGAAPVHLFNFILRLAPYDSVGSVNTLNETNAYVSFMPCNLLEMLYAVVFSNKFGVSGTRYPVDYQTRFDEIMASLFTDHFRVAIRDGVDTLWTANLGGGFAAITTTSLHRT